MTDHQLGDAPIEPQFIEHMNHAARAIDQFFNGELKCRVCRL